MSENKMRIVPDTVYVPAGEYFLGDPVCAFDTQEEWLEVTRVNDFFVDDNPIAITPDGQEMLVFKAGDYSGPLDAITGRLRALERPECFMMYSDKIGLVPLSTCTTPRSQLEQNGTIVTFDRPTLCIRADGGRHLHFGDFHIPTDPEYHVDENGLRPNQRKKR